MASKASDGPGIPRRAFLRTGAALGLAAGVGAKAAERAAEGRPNVIVFFTDQQRWDSVGAYGSPMGLTPNLDGMAARGTRFEKAFTCQPVCAPARSSIQTGRYATATTVWRNGRILPAAERTLAHHFGAAGYRVGYIGKWHLAATNRKPVPRERRGGYDGYWLASDVLEFTSHPYEGVLFDAENRPVRWEGRYRVDVLTDRAIGFVGADASRPFFLFLSFLEPHHQNDMNRFVAPKGYAERYKNPYVPPDLRPFPGNWYSELPDYYGIIARIDECLGRLLAALERLGIAGKTIVLFTTDHGCHFCTRNTEYKRCCHDGATRIPMVAQGPGFDRGRVVPEIVSLVDVAPTLLEAAGLPAHDAMQGRSLLPLLERRAEGWRNEAFIQVSEYLVGRALRTDRWKYCVFAPEKNGGRDPRADVYVERHLYDLAADPHEHVNLVGRPPYRKIAEALRERLLRRIVEAGEPRPRIERARYYA